MQILDNQSSLIIEGLNDKQIQSVTSNSSSNLVIAGAGSGKTSVLTKRVAYLISKNIQPGQILCLTFTNKAAGEMNDRLRKMLNEVGVDLPYTPVWQNDYLHSPLLCTFHSLGVRILREFGEKINLKKEFNILDSDDQKKVIKEILKEKNIDIKKLNPGLVVYFISKCKQESLLAKDSKKITQEFLPIFHEIYEQYEKRLKANQAVDFDDLILLPYLLLKTDSETREILQDRWKHVLVDEFQDTNPAQFDLIKLLQPAKKLDKENTDQVPSRSIFVVGDDAQSIYGFRGSKIEIILNFEREYPGTVEIILNQNYRSTQPILDLAEKVLTHNPGQKKKELFTENKLNTKVKFYLAKNERDEAEYIIRQLHKQYVIKNEDTKTDDQKDEGIEFVADDYFEESLTSKITETKTTTSSFSDPVSNMFDFYLETETTTSQIGSYTPADWQVPSYNWASIKNLNDCVVLYRTHSQSRSIEEAFLKHNVPYRLVSGTRFLDRKEVKDVISMLKFLTNGEDKISLSRFLPLILDGVGAKTMQKIIAYLEDFEYPLAEKYQQKVLNLLQDFQTIWQDSDDLITLTRKLILVSGYEKYLEKAYPVREEREARIENLGELYSLMRPFDEDKEAELPVRLQNFLEQIALMSKLDNKEDENTPKVNLMSLHQSKGLEFETVFLIGVEDGILPHQNSILEPNGLEEEVRLAYVAVTRAKKYLHLISADSRVQFGQIKANPVSRIFRPFLDSHCDRVGGY
jgi:DNA helicase-2/ATP-dependent DNA helicase PcrA